MKTRRVFLPMFAVCGTVLALFAAGCSNKASDPTMEAAPPPPADAKPAAPATNKIRDDAAPVGTGPQNAAPATK